MKIIRGKTCRWYSAGYVWISDDGCLAAMSDKNNKWNPTGVKILKIKNDAMGQKYINHPYGRKVSVAKAVITCFCPPPPAYGSSYVIKHKDGNLSNCHYLNLEWVPYHYIHANTSSVVIEKYGQILTINKDGSVEMNGKKMTVLDSFYDSDQDLEVCSSCPFVAVPQKNSIYRAPIFIDDLMKEAGYVQGDDANLTSPVILHKDNDYMNCDSDNLEWVESTDKRYCDFLNQKEKDRHQKLVKNNPGKRLP